MKRTVDEKVCYNKTRQGDFSTGYCFGVNLYRDYPKGDSELKEISRNIVTNAKKLAKKGNNYGKGVMCGIRDAANERKARQGK